MPFVLLPLLLALAAPPPDAGGFSASGGQMQALVTADGGCGSAALFERAAEADWRLRSQSRCDEADLDALRAAVGALRRCAGLDPAGAVDGGLSSSPDAGAVDGGAMDGGQGAARDAGSERWRFPVTRVEPGRAIEGERGSWLLNRRRACYAEPQIGHPAHDLFVPDRHPTGRDRSGQPFPTAAIEEGWVLVARDGWSAGDDAKGGNYVLLYVPRLDAVAYYAHLEAPAVAAGSHVVRGQSLGLVGRTGRNAAKVRSPTHLHFGLWDATTFRPFDPLPWLRRAEQPPPPEAVGADGGR